MKYKTKHINGVELRATDYLPNIYVSRDGKMIWNSRVPFQYKQIDPSLYTSEYHLLTPTKSVHCIVARAWVYNPCPSIFTVVDHIDNNTHNNGADNLRWVNQKLNMANLQFGVGVSFCKKWQKWVARVMDGKETFARRTFVHEIDAKVFAEQQREKKFLHHYKQYVLAERVQTPDHKRPPRLFYWQDAASLSATRSANYVS